MSGLFAGLTILISCLGLFGLASFMAVQRTKEIGVRKVLGASVLNLWQMLSKDFVVLVLISLCVAIPAAYYFMNNWLAQFQYRTTMSWWIFVSAGLGALAITMLTVSYQSIVAALANPVNSLEIWNRRRPKYESMKKVWEYGSRSVRENFIRTKLFKYYIMKIQTPTLPYSHTFLMLPY